MALRYPNHNDQYFKDERSDGLPIILPGWVEDVSVAVVLGTATSVVVQYTLDPEEDVDAAPSSADWIDWDAGSVTVDSGYPANSSITAVRCVPTGGTATLKVAARRKATRIR